MKTLVRVRRLRFNISLILILILILALCLLCFLFPRLLARVVSLSFFSPRCSSAHGRACGRSFCQDTRNSRTRHFHIVIFSIHFTNVTQRNATRRPEPLLPGTSSRSTKLVHGGVRYLEKAVFQLDYGQLKLVFEALNERKTLLRNAPHLAHALPIATPCYHTWEVPYYWAGMKAYDFVAGFSGLTMSRFCNAAESLVMFPTMSAVRGDDGARLKGTIVYQDGQFDDTRLNVTLACTAAHARATVANYCRVTRLIKDDDGRVIGARMRDVLDGGTFDVRAKVVLNATGPFTDDVRRMSEPTKKEIMTPAGGVHVTLPGYFAPPHAGLIVPKTKDGRVVFMLPWLGAVIAGTTAHRRR